MPNKPVHVDEHRRSKPGPTPYKGPGKKPGPKTVEVDEHRRKRPK